MAGPLSPKDQADLTIAMTNINEGLMTIVEAAAGHRAQLEAAGFSPTMSEQMAALYYSHLIERVFGKS